MKERFITAAPPMTPITEDTTWADPDGTQHSATQTRIFVPSSVFDNPALLANDPKYVQRLASMPDAERKALLYGDWDSFSGQVFAEWRNDPAHYAEAMAGKRWFGDAAGDIEAAAAANLGLLDSVGGSL